MMVFTGTMMWLLVEEVWLHGRFYGRCSCEAYAQALMLPARIR